MSNLRWILLAVGVVFLIALTAWESRRSRAASARARERARSRTDVMPPFEAATELPAGATDSHLGELPAGVDEDLQVQVEEAATLDEAALEDPVEDPVEIYAQGDEPTGTHPVLTLQDSELPELSVDRIDLEATDEAPLYPRHPLHAAAAAATPLQSHSASGAPAAPAALSVEWPPEEQRRIVSVRLVSTSDQRLSGRITRQALAACGFVHGPYRIFHQPDEHGQALLSCASLNKPGVFDPASMDYQRYSGLSLFTVLPGPLSTPQAVDHLLHTALDLSERLQARLLDEAGHELDDIGIEELRGRYRELDAMAGPPA